jgi:hypothetical protein
MKSSSEHWNAIFSKTEDSKCIQESQPFRINTLFRVTRHEIASSASRMRSYGKAVLTYIKRKPFKSLYFHWFCKHI